MQLSALLFQYACGSCFFSKKSTNFCIKNQPKSNKKTIQNRVDFLIEFWTDIFGFGLRLGSFLALILPLKQPKKGGLRKGGAIFGNDGAPNPPGSTPRPSKQLPKDPQGPKNIIQWHPLEPKNHRLGYKNPRKTLLPHNWATLPPEESPGSQNNQNSTLPQRKKH